MFIDKINNIMLRNNNIKCDFEYFQNMVDIKNNDEIKKYLIRTFKQKKMRKDGKISKSHMKSISFLEAIEYSYRKYPDFAKKVIINVNEWGYFKNLMSLYKCAHIKKNLDMKVFILKFVAEKLNNDIHNFYKKRSISTLAKWLPNPGSGYDKNTRFIKHFLPHIFEDYEYRKMNYYKKLYRKKLVMLRKKLNVFETISSNYNDLDYYDYSLLSRKCYKNSATFFHKKENKILLDKYKIELSKKLMDRGLIYIINYLKEADDFEKNTINYLWKKYNSKLLDDYLDIININFDDYDILVDMSSNIYNDNYIPEIIALILAHPENNINIVSNDFTKLTFNINDLSVMVDKITRYITDYETPLDFSNYIEQRYNDNILIIGNKNLLRYVKSNHNNNLKRNFKNVFYWTLSNNNLKIKYNNIYGKVVSNKYKNFFKEIVLNHNEFLINDKYYDIEKEFKEQRHKEIKSKDVDKKTVIEISKDENMKCNKLYIFQLFCFFIFVLIFIKSVIFYL